jgi:hypothetical protein
MPVRRGLLAAVLTLVATVAVYAVIAGGASRPETASAHQSCYDLWQHSGHTANVRWYHCHSWTTYSDNAGGSFTQARVHICGYSGYLHGVTVAHHHRDLIWDTYTDAVNHAHDYGGEGC